MEVYFDFNAPASGKNFVGRKNDINYISNMLSSGESIALYGEPHNGYKSTVRQSLTFMQMSGKSFSVTEVDLLTARTNEDVVASYLTAAMKTLASSVEDAQDMFAQYLDDTHILFDVDAYLCAAPYVKFNARLDQYDCEKAFMLPYLLAQQNDMRLIFFFQHFQNADADADSHILLKAFEKVMSESNGRCSMVFTGDRMNAMKEIFEVKRYFWKDAVIFPLSEVPVNDAAEHIHRGFQAKGKVIERTQICDIIRMFRNNMWYVNLFFFIDDYVSIGYATQKSFDETMDFMMGIYRNRYISWVADLTDFQLRMLKAVIDGETRLSSSTVVEKYSLNSSANVKRVKDALMKKEVLWFDERDEPHIQDVLFEMWLRRYFFVE